MNTLRFIVFYIKQIKWLFLLSLVLTVSEVVSLILITYSQKDIIDEVFISRNYEAFPKIITIFGIAVLVFSGAFLYVRYLLEWNTAKLQLILVERLMRSIQKTPLLRIQKERTASYVEHLTKDVQGAASLIANDIPKGIQYVLDLILLGTIVWFSSPYILLGITCIGVVYVAVTKRYGKMSRTISKEVAESKGKVLVHLDEGISSTREVIAYHRMDWEKQKLRNAFAAFFQKQMKESKFYNKKIMSTEPLSWGAHFLVLAYGGYLVFNGSLSIGTFVIVYRFTSQLLESYNLLFNIIMLVSSKMANVDRINRLFQEADHDVGKIPLEGEVETISFQNVSFRYSNDSQQILHEVSLHLPLKKKIAFVGPSGGGKSTLSQLLLRFYEPSTGSIEVNGTKLSEIVKKDWMDKVGVVFQEPYFFPDTIRNNLTLGLTGATEEQIVQACQDALIHDYIMELPNGYDEVIGERGITLSGGQRQRLAIARAILRNPDLLILDEATSALDLDTERIIQKNLDLVRKGKTTIVIAHRLSTIMNADHIFVVKNGITEQGTHEELMNVGMTYRNLFSLQKREESLA